MIASRPQLKNTILKHKNEKQKRKAYVQQLES